MKERGRVEERESEPLRLLVRLSHSTCGSGGVKTKHSRGTEQGRKKSAFMTLTRSQRGEKEREGGRGKSVCPAGTGEIPNVSARQHRKSGKEGEAEEEAEAAAVAGRKVNMTLFVEGMRVGKGGVATWVTATKLTFRIA